MPNDNKPTGDNGSGNDSTWSKFKKAFKRIFKRRWILILLLKLLDIDLDDSKEK